jgi:hypothetical protein
MRTNQSTATYKFHFANAEKATITRNDVIEILVNAAVKNTQSDLYNRVKAD